jgi:hypothetical protein
MRVAGPAEASQQEHRRLARPFGGTPGPPAGRRPRASERRLDGWSGGTARSCSIAGHQAQPSERAAPLALEGEGRHFEELPAAPGAKWVWLEGREATADALKQPAVDTTEEEISAKSSAQSKDVAPEEDAPAGRGGGGWGARSRCPPSEDRGGREIVRSRVQVAGVVQERLTREGWQGAIRLHCPKSFFHK